MCGRVVAPPSSCSFWRLPTGIASRATRWSRRCGPTWSVEAGAANLRKAAHHARQALASSEAVVLRGGQVALFPSRPVETDAGRFEARGRAALAGGDAAACAAAASAYAGDLLPEALYEEWTQAPRERLRSRYVELLRRSGQWERLVEVEPTDEPAYRELMRRELAAGSRPAAIRWYGRLRTALRRELGILPSGDTEAIYDECVAGLGITEPAFVGRQLELARATALLRSEPGARARRARRAGPGRHRQVGALPGGGTGGTGRGLDGDRRRGHRGGRPVCAPRERGRAARSAGTGRCSTPSAAGGARCWPS